MGQLWINNGRTRALNRKPPGLIRLLLHGLYGLYAWLVFVAIVLYTVVVGVVVPGADRRAKLATAASRAIFVLTRAQPEIIGFENLPDGNCVVVANHASYVDGFLLKGYLPWRFSFVVKGEMRNIPVVHFMLHRAGARFVERSQADGRSRDARTIVKAAKGGQSLAFFPEGTFIEEPGVGRFRPGAFVAAIKGDIPVVPVALTGTRNMMPAGRILPRPFPIRIEILPPIGPAAPEFCQSRALAEAARQQILAVLDEPDLVEADLFEADKRPN
jgi:1-acyl-sn-glycerol-3-phosphate acyltransferase